MLMGEVQEGCLRDEFLQPKMEGCTEIGHTFCTNEVFKSHLSPDIEFNRVKFHLVAVQVDSYQE